MQAFNGFFDDANVFEVPLRGRTYTWSSRRPTPTFSRLDRALISEQWNGFGATYNLIDIPATASDHAPLLLTIKPHTNPPRRPFKFKLFWMGQQDIQEVVASAWNSAQPTPDAA